MLKLQQIENKLKEINEAAFQDLCDSFIFYTEPECDTIHRVGSVEGKQKTSKGTPDSYYVMRNGKYVLLEYTTLSAEPKNKLLDKIRTDIDKCAQLITDGIETENIEKITYCLNNNLDIADHNSLREYAASKHLHFDLKSLGTLSIALLGKVSHLAKEFLGINIDSGQILDTKGFISGYESSGYSTPLSNQFIGREEELKKLEEMCSISGVTILTGPAGVGKTKLALGLFDKIKQRSPSTHIFCIDNKHVPIWDDLKTYIQNDKNYIILIDDANRQITNLKPLLSLLRENRSGKLHIIATVRDYAVEEVERFTEEYRHEIIRIEKLTDEQLTALLQTPDFEIYNHLYIKRILEIADGNPRLAIMTARVAKEKNKLESLYDVSEIYDAYFEKAISPDVFTNTIHLKTIGIISFFHSISKENTEKHKRILVDFGLDRVEFEQSLLELENLELVESSPDMLTYKISDQVMGTFFFYYTFFKNEILNFDTVLQQYFSSDYGRIQDTVIPANNAFGYSNVFAKIDPYLNSFWKMIVTNEPVALKFLRLFWLYKQDEALLFASTKIATLPVLEKPVFMYDEQQMNKNYGEQDEYLSVLSSFFYYPLGTTKDALRLAADYVYKKNDRYGELVKMLKSSIIYNREDEFNGFYRQHEFIDFLTDEAGEFDCSIRQHLFFDVVPHLMKTSFNVTTSARKRNSIAFYQYQLPLTDDIKQLREKIWSQLDNLYTSHPDKSIRFILNYIQRTPDKVKEVFTFDRPLVEKIMRSHLTPKSFLDCYVVQEYIIWFKRTKIPGDYSDLHESFTSEAYKSYLILSYDYARGRSADDTHLGYEEFQSKKEKEIRKSFPITNQDDFLKFYSQYCEIHKGICFIDNRQTLQFSLDIVLHEAYKNVSVDDYYLHVASTGNESGFVAFRIFNELKNDIRLFRAFYSKLVLMDFKAKDLWLNNWFMLLPEEYTTDNDVNAYLNLLEGSTDIRHVEYDKLLKFHNTSDDFGKRFLEIVWKMNSENNRWLQLYDLFENHLDKFQNIWVFVKKIYFQQQLKHEAYDFKFKIFYDILLKDKAFLNEYLTEWLKGHHFSLKEHEGLSIAWNHPEANEIMENAMDYLSKCGHYSIKEDICNVLFRGLPAEKKQEAIDFLEQYIIKNNEDTDKVDAGFDCIRHSFPEWLEKILLAFLAVQQSFEIFSKISWTTSYMFGSGRTSFGEMKAGQYQTILSILEKIPEKSYLFAKHKAYIKERIDAEKRYAAKERKRMFIEQDW